jgi:Retrotransposon gag protein
METKEKKTSQKIIIKEQPKRSSSETEIIKEEKLEDTSHISLSEIPMKKPKFQTVIDGEEEEEENQPNQIKYLNLLDQLQIMEDRIRLLEEKIEELQSNTQFNTSVPTHHNPKEDTKITTFSGTGNPSIWIERMRIIAGIRNWNDNMLLAQMKLNLDGEAQQWYNGFNSTHQNHSLKDFVQNLRETFSEVKSSSIWQMKLLELHQSQEMSVQKYKIKFLDMATKAYGQDLGNVPLTILKGQFYSGLREDIK